MIKLRKLKYKKNFDKRFHRNIHVSRPQKRSSNPFYQPVLDTLTGKAMETDFSEIQCFFRSIRPEMFLKKRKKFAEFTGVNAGVGVSFL